MTVADFILHLDFGTQPVLIRNRQKFSYFEGLAVDLVHKARGTMKQIKNLPVLGINTTVSNGEAWIVVTVAD